MRIENSIVTSSYKTIPLARNTLQVVWFFLALLEERKDAVTEYDVRLWYGMVEFVTVYSKEDIRFTMKDGTEIRV